MAKFEYHCRDCERIIGDRCEDVNRWMDELFAKFAAGHRRYRHHWNGVHEARQLWGDRGMKAAIIHIVRDCGEIPNQEDYDKINLGVVLAPEYLFYDGLNEKAFDKFKQAVEAEFENACLKF